MKMNAVQETSIMGKKEPAQRPGAADGSCLLFVQWTVLQLPYAMYNNRHMVSSNRGVIILREASRWGPWLDQNRTCPVGLCSLHFTLDMQANGSV